MSKRGLTQKKTDEHAITLERAMVTRHYLMTWDLDRCVGCQIGPLVCPKEAVLHVEGEIVDGRLAKVPSVDIDAEKCVLCGICEIMCPKNDVSITINGKYENPVLTQGAFPELVQSTKFDKEQFNMRRKNFVIDNCPTGVISYDKKQKTLVVDQEHCIRCRQCEVASKGAFQVVHADVCPTRALHIDDADGEHPGELTLADYYCIKCGACMQVCPIRPEHEDYEVTFESQGVTKTVVHQRLTNEGDLPILVERWRVGHTPVESAAWIEALGKMADDKAGQVEIDRKRALKRRDLLKALVGGRELLGEE